MLVCELLYLLALKFKFQTKEMINFSEFIQFHCLYLKVKILCGFCILADCWIHANILAAIVFLIVFNYSNQSLKVIPTQSGPFYLSKE